MKVRVAQMKGQIAPAEIKSIKDPGAPVIEENGTGATTAVARAAIREVIAGTAIVIAHTTRTGEIDLVTGAIAKSEEAIRPII